MEEDEDDGDEDDDEDVAEIGTHRKEQSQHDGSQNELGTVNRFTSHTKN